MVKAQVQEIPKPEYVVHQSADSPVARRASTDSRHQRFNDHRNNLNDPTRKASQTSGGYDRSIEQSPLHRNPAKASGVAPNTPGRIKTRASAHGDESPDGGPAVPKFGEWDESNPASADGFTDIFNKVREDKQTGSAKVPQITDDSNYPNRYGHGSSYKSSSCFCFNWCKK